MNKTNLKQVFHIHTFYIHDIQYLISTLNINSANKSTNCQGVVLTIGIRSLPRKTLRRWIKGQAHCYKEPLPIQTSQHKMAKMGSMLKFHYFFSKLGIFPTRIDTKKSTIKFSILSPKTLLSACLVSLPYFGCLIWFLSSSSDCRRDFWEAFKKTYEKIDIAD